VARLPEQRAWDTFSRDVGETLTFRVENMCVDGMSDVIGINRQGTVFWLENKALAGWPALSTTFPLRDVFEPGQIPFMRQWRWWKGHAYVLLRVGLDYYLLDPRMDLKEMTAMEIIDGAIHIGKRTIQNYLESI
jgi:hypothetical protein